MATLDEAIAKGHERYFKNAYWKGIYDNAPEDAKKYYDLNFSQMDGGAEKENDAAYRSRMEAVLKGMTDSGWEYILDNTNNAMAKHYLKQKREKFAKKSE